MAEKILHMTRAIVLTGIDEQEERDVEVYADLMAARQPLVAKLMELKKQISAEMVATAEFEDIKQILSDITDLDIQHHAFMEEMRVAVQGAIKKVKTGQRVYEGYQTVLDENSYHMFDKKQ